MRFDAVFGDVEPSDVWQRAFQTVADLDENLSILREDEQHHPVTLFLLSNAPCLRDALRVSGNIVVALHFWKHRDHDLIGSLTFELRELFIEAISGFF